MTNHKFECIIIDDEPGNIVTLSEMIKEYCPGIVLVGSAPDSNKGFELIKETDPDLVFLDIEMPYGNAFDLLDKVSPARFEVIFVTAFDNYAIKAIHYSALEYILKPVNIQELKKAVDKAILRLNEKKVNTKIISFLDDYRSQKTTQNRIGLPTNLGFRFEDVNNIMFIQAEGNFCYVFTKGQKKEFVSKSLKEFEDMLPESIFCRIHHSHIININFVKNYFKGRGGHVEMEDGTVIEVSVRKRTDFFDRFTH